MYGPLGVLSVCDRTFCWIWQCQKLSVLSCSNIFQRVLASCIHNLFSRVAQGYKDPEWWLPWVSVELLHL